MDVWIAYLKTALAEEKTKPFKHNEKTDSHLKREQRPIYLYLGIYLTHSNLQSGVN